MNGMDLISLSREESGSVLISLMMYDENNSLILKIDQNEWICENSKIWDLSFKYKKLSIRQGKGNIKFELDLSEEVIKLQADMWKDGQHIRLDPFGISIDGSNTFVFQGVVFINMSLNLSDGFTLGPGVNGNGTMIIGGPPEDGRRIWKELMGRDITST